MASIRLTKRFSEELTCPICMDRFKDPTVLPCLHTFCKTCLHKVTARLPNIGKIFCGGGVITLFQLISYFAGVIICRRYRVSNVSYTTLITSKWSGWLVG